MHPTRLHLGGGGGGGGGESKGRGGKKKKKTKKGDELRGERGQLSCQQG